MAFFKEFKAFALKGNIVDLAVAVIIGAAFSAIISSFVDDVITPLLLTPALNAVGAADVDKLQWGNVKSVSYTHLDVYKRQPPNKPILPPLA